MKRAILTGATSIIGVALAKYLAERGVSVTAVTRPQSKRIANVPVSENIRLVECDLDALSSLVEILPHDYDAFFHLGWNAASREMTQDPVAQTQSILHTLNAVKTAHALGCGVFVGAGSQAEYGRAESPLSENTVTNPETSYGIAKYAAGKLSLQLSAKLGMRHCWCRILSVYGPYDKEDTGIMYCIRSLLRGESPSLTKAEQSWDYIFSGDCAKALYFVAEKGQHGAIYPVGSGRASRLRDYFETIRDIVAPSVKLNVGDKEYPVGQIMYLCADITKLTRDTGFQPDYSFDAGIRETLKWLQNKDATL
ncbi:MAG: NAD(P)-dependent oxidoreductase [Thermoguttaceae bacterium]